jgi:uncharacterized protein YciW
MYAHIIRKHEAIILSDRYSLSLAAATVTHVWAATESAEFYTFREPTKSDKQYWLHEKSLCRSSWDRCSI